jgi:hypothetical protein
MMNASISKRVERTVSLNKLIETGACVFGLVKALSFFKKHRLVIGATREFWRAVDDLKDSGIDVIPCAAASEYLRFKASARRVRICIKPNVLAKKLLDDPDFTEYAFVIFNDMPNTLRARAESNVMRLLAADISKMTTRAVERRLDVITASLGECIERQRMLLNEQTILNEAVKLGDAARFFDTPTLEELIIDEELSEDARLNVAIEILSAISGHAPRTQTKKKKKKASKR